MLVSKQQVLVSSTEGKENIWRYLTMKNKQLYVK